MKTYIQTNPSTPEIHRITTGEHLLDLELPVGIPARCRRTRQPFLNHDGGAAGSLAKLRGTRVANGGVSAGNRRHARVVPYFHTGFPEVGRRDDWPSGRRVSAH